MFTRIVDCAISAVVLLVLCPFSLIIAFLIKVEDGGPIFYRAQRVGKQNKLFYLYKFRSMIVNADQVGAGVTIKGDSRITRIGRILRKYKIDEFPQFINVLIGDMSIVGARPEDPRYVALYNTPQRKILLHKPGITSPASLTYRHEESLLAGENWEQVYIEQVLPDKLAIDLEYLSTRSIQSDIHIISKTLFAVIQ